MSSCDTDCNVQIGLERTGPIPWAGGPTEASFGFFKDKHSKARPTQKILHNETFGTDML